MFTVDDINAVIVQIFNDFSLTQDRVIREELSRQILQFFKETNGFAENIAVLLNSALSENSKPDDIIRLKKALFIKLELLFDRYIQDIKNT